MKSRVVLLAVVVVGGIATFVAAAQAEKTTSTTQDPVDKMLLDARRHTVDHDYSGVVVVRWIDTDGAPHSEQAIVAYHDGVMEINDNGRVVASTPDGLLLDGAAWSAAPSAALSGASGASKKYDVSRAAGRTVAGRSTTVLDARRRGDHVLVERYYIDNTTGLVLRRESYDGAGAPERSFEFSQVWASANGAGLPPMQPASTAPATGVHLVSGVEAPYHAPARAGVGFHLVGRWQHPSSVVQLSYGDGLLSASVFEQPGTLNWAALPSGGKQIAVRGNPGVAYSLPVGDALVWERGGMVYTCVGDAPRAELLSLAADVSRPGQDATYTRLARVVLAPFRW
ncbi:MAG: sigma regulatory protein MucB/RseB [Actinomycetia bacterium]|nr:sigma regulatory protein MucB/RseB [Actinomycetes bacterium]